MTQLREGLPELPVRMRKLPVDHRGYPIPWFVAYIDGKPDFRVADTEKSLKAQRFGNCWVCGEVVGKYKTFVIGPMCAVNRTTAEPPCHFDCAEFSAIACPFLTLPKAVRRDANMPAHVPPPGEMIERNPGVVCLWTCLTYRMWGSGLRKLVELGDPESVVFYKEKRLATRAEILESIDSGMPLLRNTAKVHDGPSGERMLEKFYQRMLTLLPAA